MHTADEGVLAGTVRRLLLEVCMREGIPVVFRPPLLQAPCIFQQSPRRELAPSLEKV